MRAGVVLGTPKLRGLKITEEDAPLIAKMQPDYQQVLAMSQHVSGDYVDYQAMAVHLCIPVGTVKSRLSRARAALVAARSAQDKA